MQYLVTLPLTKVSIISDKMVEAAFSQMLKMGSGGDDPEDVLTGLLFTITDPGHGLQFFSNLSSLSIFLSHEARK